MPYLNVPFGTYSHSPQLVIGKDGAIYTTGIGDMSKKRTWRGRVWKFTPQGPAEMVFEAPGAHLALHVIGNQLFCAWIDLKGKVGYDIIEGYIPLESELPMRTVNVNETQLDQLKQQLAQAQENASRAQRASESLSAKVDQLTQRIKELEKRPTAQSAASVNPNEIADIVWAKMWDSIYLLRMGMNSGFSSDVNIAGWINDLTAFIRKVSNGK